MHQAHGPKKSERPPLLLNRTDSSLVLPSSPEVEIMSSTKKRFSSASTLVTPTRSSKRIKQGPQMRANKKMQRIEMSKGDTIRDLKIKVRFSSFPLPPL